METRSFADIAPEFNARVARIVWCTVTTVDGKGRPRSRILHPVWEGSTGWIATGRQTLKAKHLAGNPYVSLTYWDPQHQQVYADCRAQWADDPETKRRIWELYKATPPPLGYDLVMFWKSPEDPTLGILKLTPWRIELSAISDLATRTPPRVWHP